MKHIESIKRIFEAMDADENIEANEERHLAALHYALPGGMAELELDARKLIQRMSVVWDAADCVDETLLGRIDRARYALYHFIMFTEGERK